jgi:arsenate reductase
MIHNADKIINMGCKDKNFCPTLFVPKVLDWGVEDPKGKPMEKVSDIRDEIEGEIKELVDEMGKENTTIVQQYMLSYICSKEPYLRY